MRREPRVRVRVRALIVYLRIGDFFTQLTVKLRPPVVFSRWVSEVK